MRLGTKRAGMVALVLLLLAIAGCGVSRQQYVQNLQGLRKDIKDLRQQLEAQKGILDSHGKALAENRLSIKDNTAALANMRASVRAAKEAADKALSKVLAEAKKPKEIKALPLTAKAALAPGSLVRVRSQVRGRPLYFAGGFDRPGAKRYILRLLPGTIMRLLGEKTEKFARVKVLSPQKMAGRVVWVRIRWLEPVE